jgi:O-antigen ligase
MEACMSLVPGAEWWRPEPAGAAGSRSPDAFDPGIRASSGRLAFRALLALTFILVLAPQSFFPALRPFRLALLAAAAGIAACVGDRLVHGRPLTILGREMALAAALMAWSVVTVPLSYWPGGSVSFLLDTYFKTMAIFWLLANAVDSVDRLRALAWSLTAMAVPLALTGVKNFVSGVLLDKNRILGYDGGLTGNPNDLALMLNVLLPFGVALLLASRSALARVLLLAIVLLEATAVIATFSRAGFLSLATSAALYLWHLGRRGRTGWMLTALLACVGGAILLPGSYLTRLATITNIEADPTGSAQERLDDTMAAVQFVAANPLIGAGIGMDIGALNEVRGAASRQLQVHNAYLEYAVDLGLPGLVLFTLLFVSCVRRLQAIRRAPAEGPAGEQLSCLAVGVEIALLSFAVEALFAPVAYQFYFYYLGGVAVAASHIHRKLAAADESRRGLGCAS